MGGLVGGWGPQQQSAHPHTAHRRTAGRCSQPLPPPLPLLRLTRPPDCAAKQRAEAQAARAEAELERMERRKKELERQLGRPGGPAARP